MTYLIGSTRDDGWYVKGFRIMGGMLGDKVSYCQWTQDRSQAAEFTQAQRDRCTLPFMGCWLMVNPESYFTPAVPFEVGSEADETR